MKTKNDNKPRLKSRYDIIWLKSITEIYANVSDKLMKRVRGRGKKIKFHLISEFTVPKRAKQKWNELASGSPAWYHCRLSMLFDIDMCYLMIEEMYLEGKYETCDQTNWLLLQRRHTIWYQTAKIHDELAGQTRIAPTQETFSHVLVKCFWTADYQSLVVTMFCQILCCENLGNQASLSADHWKSIIRKLLKNDFKYFVNIAEVSWEWESISAANKAFKIFENMS